MKKTNPLTGLKIVILFLRWAHQHVSDLDRPVVDEKILDEIFGRFCIGK